MIHPILIFFFKGILMGMFVAIPTGPVGFLCVKRAVTQGMKSAVVSGIGSATADLFYSITVTFGLTYISHFLLGHRHTLMLGGGILLLVLAYRTYVRRFRVHEVETGVGYVNDFLSTFLLTFTNPTLIVSFTFLFTALGVARTVGHPLMATAFVGGVFLGSVLWWTGISFIVSLYRSRFTDDTLRKVNVFSAVVIAIAGLFILSTLIF